MDSRINQIQFQKQIDDIRTVIQNLYDNTGYYKKKSVADYKSRLDTAAVKLKTLIAEPLYSIVKPYRTIKNITDQLAILYFNAKQHDKAATFYQLSLDATHQIGDDDDSLRFIVLCYVNICDCYYELANVNMERKMLHEAVKTFHKIRKKTAEEQCLADSDNGSQLFIAEFRKFHDNQVSTDYYVNSSAFKTNNTFLTQTYNPDEFFCDDIASLSLCAFNQKNTLAIKSMTELDYLNAALEYLQIIKNELSRHPKIDTTTQKNLQETCHTALRFLDNIKCTAQLSLEQQHMMQTTYCELNSTHAMLEQLNKPQPKVTTIIYSAPTTSTSSTSYYTARSYADTFFSSSTPPMAPATHDDSAMDIDYEVNSSFF